MSAEARPPDGEVAERADRWSEGVVGLAAGVFLLVGGWLVLGGGARDAAAAVVLWTAALAMAGIAFGRPVARRVTGARREEARAPREGEGGVASARRFLTLSERLALGPLGGLLGGTVVALTAWVVAGLGLAGVLGVDLGAGGGLPDFGRRLWSGALWGLALGVFYRRIPGRTPVGRGLVFSLLPASWALFVEYPFLMGLGWAGAELGPLTFLLVIGLHLVWGGVTGAVFQWAELTSEGALDRPLGPASS